MKLVLCSGCFDVLHVGHVLHLQAAKEQGDRLVVALAADRHVHKGPGRPVNTAWKREMVLRELRSVDDVVVYDEPVPFGVIRLLKPDVYVKGIDYFGRHIPEQELVESLGGRVVFTTTAKYSSSEILERMQ